MSGPVDARDRAAVRFAQFQRRPQVQRVAEDYADWALSSVGIMISVQLSGLAQLRLGGRLSRHEYRRAVRGLAMTSGVPLRDFLIIAKGGLELSRCALAGTGQIPFDPAGWDAEDGAE